MSSFSVEPGKGPARCADYGVDAPYAPILMALGGAALLALAVTRLWAGGGRPVASAAPALAGVWLLLNAATFIHTTRAGKFAVWADLLASLKLKGDERLLDIGCGRGAVLLVAAKRLPRGRATGVDVWSTKDQSGNAEQVTRRNAALEGVADRIELQTADMRKLPFEDGAFDVVVSSLAIHNVPGARERAKALREAARVLKTGGRLMIADIRHTSDYARELEACGLTITGAAVAGDALLVRLRTVGRDPPGRRKQTVIGKRLQPAAAGAIMSRSEVPMRTRLSVGTRIAPQEVMTASRL